MMMTSRAVKLAAGAVAVCAHGALAVSLMPEADPVAMEGSSGGVSARLGTSFMDMAQGSIAAQSVDTPIEAEQPGHPRTCHAAGAGHSLCCTSNACRGQADGV